MLHSPHFINRKYLHYRVNQTNIQKVSRAFCIYPQFAPHWVCFPSVFLTLAAFIMHLSGWRGKICSESRVLLTICLLKASDAWCDSSLTYLLNHKIQPSGDFALNHLMQIAL